MINITPQYLQYGDKVNGRTVVFVVVYPRYVSVKFSDGGSVRYPLTLSLTVERENA